MCPARCRARCSSQFDDRSRPEPQTPQRKERIALAKRAFVHTVRYLRANALALTALFVALGGTGYAAAGLRSHSASTRKPVLTAHGQVVAWAIVNGKGHVVAGSPRPHVVGNSLGGFYQVSWRGVPTSPTRKMYCATPVTVDGQFSAPDTTLNGRPGVAGYADVINKGHTVYVTTFDPWGNGTPLGFEVALICPAS